MEWKTVCFKLEQDLAMELYELARKKDKQVSEILRELVRSYVELEKYREVKEPKKMKVL
jgi:predicted transcriptional regulator